MRTVLPLCLVAVVGLGPGAPVTPRTLANDNRTPAGVLRAGVLTLRLEARLGRWHPDGEAAPGVDFPAFAQEGRAPSIPGPLLRVPAGTVVAVAVRNALRDTLVLHGLHDRTGTAASAQALAGVRLAPGEVRALRFRLDAPGTYYYWGTTTGRDVIWRTGVDGQLTGAIVVDAAGTPPPRDRILVLGMWTDTVARANVPRQRVLAVINGRSWPFTERLVYDVGDTVRWRVINATGDNHPMHLHGFYFRVIRRGDGRVGSSWALDRADQEVTESLPPGTTADLVWVAERPGDWLFHCHIPEHIGRRGPLGMPAAPTAHAAMTHDAAGGMGGLVLGVVVRPSGAYTAAGGPANGPDRRRLRLVIRRNAGGSEREPYYAFAPGDAGVATLPDSGLRVGPPLVLTRGQPVSITVVNTIAEPTAVHWHGIELESYYDGVPGFSGTGRRLAPLIAPGDSFEVRFTPPRAGTFIYHTHVDEERQEPAGLAGPIVVLEPGQSWDPETDHTVMITSPWGFEEERRALLLNGSHTPPPLVLRAGVPHRLRIVNMTLRHPALWVELRRDSALAPWRQLARDGADLPEDRRAPQPGALRAVSIGQTYDVEIPPLEPGDLHLDVRQGGVNLTEHPLLVTLPLRIARE